MLFGKKKELTVKLEGLHCEKCVEKVVNAMKAIGVKADVDLKLGKASLKCPEKLEFDAVKQAIEALGFKCELIK